MKAALCLAILATSALWADEAADRAAVEKTISALNAPATSPDIFTADFPNAADLQAFRTQTRPPIPPSPANGTVIQTDAGTLVISRAPMGEATWYPGGQPSYAAIVTVPRFVTRSITFTTPDTAVVVAAYNQKTVLFVLKQQGPDWKIASFQVIPEAKSQIL